MNTKYKRFKYEVIVPSLIRLRKIMRKDENRNNSSLEGIPKSFFIMGSGRNGSTVLAKTLNRHSDLFLPPENWALPFSIMKWHLALRVNWIEFVKGFVDDFKSNGNNWILTDEDYNEITNVLKTLNKKHRNIPNCFRLICDCYRSKFKEKVMYVGDHSPINTRYYKYVVDEFKFSKFIFLIRDPIDTIYSFTKIKDHPLSSPEKAVWTWNQSIECYDYLISKVGESVLLVKYEDFVNDPSNISASLENHLGIHMEDIANKPKTKTNKDIVGAKGHDHHRNVHRPITDDFIGKGWRNFSDAKIDSLVKGVRHNAERFGYLK